MRRLMLVCVAAFALASTSLFPHDAATRAQSPTVAPTPDPISTPFVVKLEGPTKATGGFAVTVTKPAAAVCRWRNELPEGSMPLELTDNAGRTVLCFFSPAPGVHRFHLAAQLPVDGLDPFAEASLVVEVGPVVPAPPLVDPVDPALPTETNPSLNQLTTLLRANPSAAESMRAFYAVLAAEVRNDAAGGLKTIADLRAWQVAKERATFANTAVTKIKGVAAAIGGFLDAELGLADVKLDHAKAAAAFERLSAACGKAVRA